MWMWTCGGCVVDVWAWGIWTCGGWLHVVVVVVWRLWTYGCLVGVDVNVWCSCMAGVVCGGQSRVSLVLFCS